MTETDIMRLILLEAPKRGCVLFRNNVGAFKDRRGIWCRFGVGGNGGSDLIGWKRAVSLKLKTQDHATDAVLEWLREVQNKMDPMGPAFFLAVEVKASNWKPPKSGKAKKHWDEQKAFIDLVNKNGGIAGVCRSVEDFIKLVG